MGAKWPQSGPSQTLAGLREGQGRQAGHRDSTIGHTGKCYGALHCCAAARDGAGDAPQALPPARGDRPGKLPPSTGHRGPAAQQAQGDTAFCTNPPPPSPSQPLPPAPRAL